MGRLLTYERRIVGTALLAVVPLAVAAVLLVWAGNYPPVVTWTVALLIGATLGVATVALYEVVAYPLRTVANVISAVREEDYSIRAREARDGAMLGEIMLELNELSATMRRRHLAALEAAALVRAVIAEVDAAIFAFDAESRVELVNRAGERLLGEELFGKTAEEIGVADLLSLPEATTVERSFGGVKARWSVRVSVFRREGETHRLLVVADISRALRQEEIRAWQRVVRVLGHELNNSLAPIKSIAGSLEEAVAMETNETPLHASLTRGLGVISRRADALARFLSVYSELARLPEPTLRAVDLDAVVRRAVALDRRLDVVIEGGPPVRIDADEDQLEQAIINVLKNAIDASLETGGGVSVRWRTNGDFAELSIVDQGPGLASTANLFTPFFTTKPGGSGIGLVLSRQIAESHGGTLELRNRSDGVGCEAVLRVPATRTEAGAVYGEYRRSASDPGLRLEEVQGDLMYGPAHGYGHSTIGYLDDVKDMPNAFRSAQKFYDDYYRPNNAIVVVVGDVKADRVFQLVEQHFGPWKAKKTPEQPDPKPINGPKKQDETWESDIPPRVLVSYMTPPYAPGSSEAAAMDVMAELMAGETAPLYKKLRYEEQVASSFGVDNTSTIGFDARPMGAFVTVAKEKYDAQGKALLDRIDRDVAAAFEGLATFSSQPDASQRLESIKSQLRYDILASFNSPSNIAQNFANYYRLNRNPQVLEQVAQAIADLKPADIDAFAKKYFTPKNRVSITLAGKGGAQ